MRRIVLLALPLLTLLGGCRSLAKDVAGVEHHSVTTPTTTAAPRAAADTLTEPPTRIAHATTELTTGATNGFSRETDGSAVAVAADQVTSITDNGTDWWYTPGPPTSWDRFVVRTRRGCKSVLGAAGVVLMAPVIIVNGCVTGNWP